MKKNTPLLLLALVLLLVLMLLVSVVLRFSGAAGNTDLTENTPTSPADTDPPTNPPTNPSTPPTESPTEPPTEPPTEAPTEAPTDPNKEYIGTLYTRDELEALSTTYDGYGPGTWDPGVRAKYAVWDQEKYSKYGANFIAPDNGNIYLTFDCGYEHYYTDADGNKIPNTARILDTLKEKNVKGVFFVTMDFVKKEPALVQRMIDEGHAVGNHSNNHKRMSQLSIDEMVYEVMSLHEYVKENFGYTMTLFRPPEGNYSVQSLCVVQSIGYKTVHWSFAYADYDTAKQPDVDYAYKRVTNSHHSGAIFLLHAISETNATILGDVIDFFRAEGYKLELFQ